jgi:hypothetical protein
MGRLTPEVAATMVKIMAIILLIALFPVATLSIIGALLVHPLFLLLLLLLLLAWPAFVAARR